MMHKICEECGRTYDNERDDFMHLMDDNHRIICRKSFNGLHCSTQIETITCPDCLIQNAAPDLYAACEEIDHFFNESVGQVCTEKQAFDAYHNSGTSEKVQAALAKAKVKE